MEQPSSIRRTRCSSLSTPSTTREIPSACANATTLLMTAQLLGWVFIFWTKVLSSLIWLKGNSQSRSRDE